MSTRALSLYFYYDTKTPSLYGWSGFAPIIFLWLFATVIVPVKHSPQDNIHKFNILTFWLIGLKRTTTSQNNYLSIRYTSHNRSNTTKPIPSGSDGQVLRPLTSSHTSDARSSVRNVFSSPQQAKASSIDLRDWDLCWHKLFSTHLERYLLSQNGKQWSSTFSLTPSEAWLCLLTPTDCLHIHRLENCMKCPSSSTYILVLSHILCTVSSLWIQHRTRSSQFWPASSTSSEPGHCSRTQGTQSLISLSPCPLHGHCLHKPSLWTLVFYFGVHSLEFIS